MNAKSGIHVWSLQKRLQEFINADNGVKFQSGEFPVADFIWQIIAYPNGNRFENYGSVMLYLKLIQFPDELKFGGQVTINFRIQCLETYSSSTFIETYQRVNDSKGWSARNLLLSDLTKESITKVTFQVDVKILKILNPHGKITYEAPLRMAKNRFNLKWIVPPEIMTRMEYANNGKWFESGNYSNLWCFKCAPNGYNESNEGAALLFIQLCALPPNISKMKCKVKLFHVESGTKWSIKKEFGYNNKNAGWTKSKCGWEKLMKHSSITFRAEIEILSLFDLHGNKSSINPSWSSSTTKSKYTATRAYDDGSMNMGSKKKKQPKHRDRRATSTVGNPYGGYGNHNYKHYFNDGYKKTEQYRKSLNPNDLEANKRDKIDENEAKEESEEDEEENYQSSASDEDEDSELELESLDDIKDQVVFLANECKKLYTIVSNLKQKSSKNDRLIVKLQKDIEALKNGLPSTYMAGVPLSSPTASNVSNASNMANYSNTRAAPSGGDILDTLFADSGGNDNTNKDSTKIQTQSSAQKPLTKENKDTFDTGNGNDAGFNGWTTF